MLSQLVGKALGVEEQIYVIRTLETKLQSLCNSGACRADLHFSTGQEAISVGVISALRPSDYIVVHHRTIAHAVAKGVPLGPLVAELLGKPSGINGGRAGEMHMSHLPSRFMFSFQLVGTCVPVAAGLAWAVEHFLKTDDIVVVFHGDAATANGQWHEGMNLAAVQKVPLLLICENNHLAGNVRPEDYQPVDAVRIRAISYGIQSRYVDGNDVQKVIAAAQDAAHYVRTERRPLLLECDTTRLGRHKQGQGDIRTAEEIALLALRDPLLTLSLTEGRRRELEAIVDSALKEVV